MLANRYEVIAKLGEGGMGTVYRVRDLLAEAGSGREEVALKLIKAQQEVTPELRLRFKEEFRAMARLRHPNTIEVYDFGQLDAQSLYITMALVPGQELGELMAGRQLPYDELYPLLIQLLQALNFIHQRGFVHRDIKPANARVRPDGRLVLMDFGLMTAAGQAAGRAVTGTAGYLAPEVAVGGAIDGATDLYAVGCLAFELITGRLPFQGSLIEVVRQHVSARPPSPRSLRSDVPLQLELLVLRLLEKQPQARYRTAEAVLSDLSSLAGVGLARETEDQQRSFLVAGGLVGRDAELAVLTGALADAREKQERAVVLAAPAGVGKSRLIQELVLTAKLGDFRVLQGGAEDKGMAPYETIARALRPALALSPPSGPAADALAHLFPERGAAPPLTPLQVAEGVAAWLGAVAAEAPTLVVVDDLHWADARSLDVFNHAVRHVSGVPLVLVGSFRDDEAPPGHAVWHTLDEDARRQLPLGPLSPAGQRVLIEAMLPGAALADEFAEALYQATGGNAYFLTEALRALLDDGAITREQGRWRFPLDAGVLAPLASIEETVARRLEVLSSEALRLLGLAAVLGRHQDTRTLLALAGEAHPPASSPGSAAGEDGFFERLDELVDGHFLVRTDDGYAFPHDRMREACYARLEPALRERFHREAGLLLEARGGDDHTLAWHFERAGDPVRAHRYLVKAGQAAKAAGSPAVALELWRRADDVLPVVGRPDAARLDLWWTMGASGWEIRPDVTASALERLLAAIDGTDDPRVVEAHAFLAVALGFGGQAARGRAEAEAALARVDAEDAVRHAAVEMVRGPALFAAGAIDELVAVATRAIAQLEHQPASQGALIASTRIGAISYAMAVAHQGLTPPPGAFERALDAVERAGVTNLFLTVRHYQALLAALRGDEAPVRAYLDWSEAYCRKSGAPPHPWMLYLRAHLGWLRGEAGPALAQLERALAMPHVQLSAPAVHYMAALRGQALLELGRLEQAEAAFTELATLAASAGLLRAAIQARLGLGELALLRRDAGAARRAFETALADAARGPGRNPLLHLQALRGRGAAAALSRDWIAARADLEAARAMARSAELENPLEQARTLLALGKVARLSGDDAGKRRLLQEAGDLYQLLGNAHGLHATLNALNDQTGPLLPARPPEDLEARWKLARGPML